MDHTHDPALSNASPNGRMGTLLPLWTLPPFVGGIITGALLSFVLIACGPEAPLWSSLVVIWTAILIGGLIATALYTATVVSFICFFSANARIPRQWIDSLMLGMLVPIFAISFWELAHVIFGFAPGNYRQETRWTLIVAALAALLAIVTPFLLVQPRQTAPKDVRLGSFRRRTLVPIVGSSLVLAAAIAIQWAQARSFERNCEKFVAWLKVNNPTPAAHLPQQFRNLASVVDWTKLPDGRIVLLLETSPSWHDCWSGVVYSSGPIRPSEIGTDAYGRPELQIPALPLPGSFISRQVDDQYFIVGFDLG